MNTLTVLSRSPNFSNSFKKYLVGASLALTVFAPLAMYGSASAAVPQSSWEIGSEFDDQANPAPTVWSYGYETTLNNTFNLSTNPVNAFSGALTGWEETNDGTGSLVIHNVAPYPNTFTAAGGPVYYGPHQLAQHPSQTCHYSDVRFTVPTKGRYKISGQWYGMDDNGVRTTTDVHVSVNGVQAFAGNIDLPLGQMSASFTSINTAMLNVGDTIDFQVGCGDNGAWNYDSTALNGVIELLGKKKK